MELGIQVAYHRIDAETGMALLHHSHALDELAERAVVAHHVPCVLAFLQHRGGKLRYRDALDSLAVIELREVREADAAHVVPVGLLVTRLAWQPHAVVYPLSYDVERIGRRKQVALEHVAPDAFKEVRLFLGLHALCERTQAEPLCRSHDTGDDGAGLLAIVSGSTHELHVQLQYVELIPLQDVERGVAAAEVVHPHLEARLVKGAHLLHEELGVGVDGRLRELHVQEVVRHAQRVGARGHLVRDLILCEILVRNVYRDGHDGHALVLLLLEVLENAADDVEIETMQQRCLLKHRYELVWGEYAILGIDPARKRLLLADLSRGGAYHRLVVRSNPPLRYAWSRLSITWMRRWASARISSVNHA